MAAKMSPSALIVIKDGVTRLVNIKNQSAINKILDMAPDMVDKFQHRKDPQTVDPEVQDAMDHAFDDYADEA